VTDFIYTEYDVLSDNLIEECINLIEQRIVEAKENKCQGTVVYGMENDKSKVGVRDDIQLYPDAVSEDITNQLWSVVQSKLPYYFNQYPDARSNSIENYINGGIKLQKTHISGGFHQWHCEQGYDEDHDDLIHRVLVWTLYLNDVDFGGETELKYQRKRITAERNKLCIFPAFFTHIHRGNPPYSNNKYIATGWINVNSSN
jgi:hypothetical protein